MSELDVLRKQIDEIDLKILDLLNKRGEIVKKIGILKQDLKIEVYQPLREQNIVEKLKKKTITLKPSSIEAIWKEIIGACKVIQNLTTKVGYLGPEGTFTHQAALEFFPKTSTELFSYKNIAEIFEQIEKDVVEFGVIPIENSLQGTVSETLDLLIEKNLLVYGEMELRIIQNLISITGSDITKIKNIYSHPQAFAQTRNWLKSNIPNAKLIYLDSTAEAIENVKKLNNTTNAAIGSRFSADLYGLNILSSNIEDDPSNFTRFLIISKKENSSKNGKLKTSLVYVTKHVPGALYRVLKLFADANINLTKIESRPRRKGKWEYTFLMDFEGNKDDPKIREVIKQLESNVIWYKILGTYPYT